MEIGQQQINDMMLDLSLATCAPLNIGGRNKTRTIAAVNAIGVVTQTMPLKELRELEYAVGPLVILLETSDIDDAVVPKAAFALKSLMTSRVCMREFIQRDGVKTIGKMFEFLLSDDLKLDLRESSHNTNVLESLCFLYQKVAVHYPWEIVRAGGIRHCIAILWRGEPAVQASAVGALGSMCDDHDIALMMFGNGASRPIIMVSDADVTSEPCMMAGLGCIAQMARIPEVGIKIARQGVVKVLEKALHMTELTNSRVIREKAITCLSWLARIPQCKHVLATPRMLKGLQQQFFDGTVLGKVACAQVLRFIHGGYPKSEAITLMRGIRQPMLEMLNQGKWTSKDQMLKSFCVLYRENEDRLWFVDNGILDMIFSIMQAKPEDLTEAPIALLLNLCTHPDVPPIIMDQGGLPIFCRILNNADAPVIIDLVTILLKVISLYDRDRVDACLDATIPVEKAHLKRMDSPDCTLFGSEYGVMVQEYCQEIVHNRWAQRYLLVQFEERNLDDLAKQLGISKDMLDAYQKSFMELDVSCRGFLEMDALRVIIVMRGEDLDDEQLQEIFDEYDTEGTGRMDFAQYCDLLSGWKNRFGYGPTALVYGAFNTGTVGRIKRAFVKWWYKNKIAREQVEKVKLKAEAERLRVQQLASKFVMSADINQKREKELALRASGKDQALLRGADENDDPLASSARPALLEGSSRARPALADASPRLALPAPKLPGSKKLALKNAGASAKPGPGKKRSSSAEGALVVAKAPADALMSNKVILKDTTNTVTTKKKKTVTIREPNNEGPETDFI